MAFDWHKRSVFSLSSGDCEFEVTTAFRGWKFMRSNLAMLSRVGGACLIALLSIRVTLNMASVSMKVEGGGQRCPVSYTTSLCRMSSLKRCSLLGWRKYVRKHFTLT